MSRRAQRTYLRVTNCVDMRRDRPGGTKPMYCVAVDMYCSMEVCWVYTGQAGGASSARASLTNQPTGIYRATSPARMPGIVASSKL